MVSSDNRNLEKSPDSFTSRSSSCENRKKKWHVVVVQNPLIPKINGFVLQSVFCPFPIGKQLILFPKNLKSLEIH